MSNEREEEDDEREEDRSDEKREEASKAAERGGCGNRRRTTMSERRTTMSERRTTMSNGERRTTMSERRTARPSCGAELVPKGQWNASHADRLHSRTDSQGLQARKMRTMLRFPFSLLEWKCWSNHGRSRAQCARSR